MRIQNHSQAVVTHTQIQGKTRIILLWLSVAVILSVTGCSDEAVKHCNLGISLWKQDKYDKAIDEFGKALELNPKFGRAYYYRANAYYDSGRYGKAWEDVHAAEDLGYSITPSFLKALREVSGRDR